MRVSAARAEDLRRVELGATGVGAVVLPSHVRDTGRRWAWILVGAAAVFIASATTVVLTGVPVPEREFYNAVTRAIPNALVFRRITRLGAVDVLLPLAVFLIVLLPRQFLRRWWMWIVVMIAVTTLEGLGKVGIGRTRPGGMRLGFPSGHTAAAASFYLMACYFFEGVVRRWQKYALYGLAVVIIGLVGLSRMVLRVHWPLDVLGGAALGVAVFAAAAWWHERFPLEDIVPAAVPPRWRAWIYRWQNVLPFALIVVRSCRRRWRRRGRPSTSCSTCSAPRAWQPGWRSACGRPRIATAPPCLRGRQSRSRPRDPTRSCGIPFRSRRC